MTDIERQLHTAWTVTNCQMTTAKGLTRDKVCPHYHLSHYNPHIFKNKCWRSKGLPTNDTVWTNKRWIFGLFFPSVGELRPNPPVISFFPTSVFSYKLIRFLLHSSIVKSDNEIGKFTIKIWNVPRGLVLTFYSNILSKGL